MGRLHEEEVEMSACIVCSSTETGTEMVEEVFKVDGRYVLVGGVPSTVCQRCGERSFSRETTEKVRQLVHGQAEAAKSVPMQVYELVDV